MWLTYPLMCKLKPAEQDGWYELDGKPYRPDYLEVREFASDHFDKLVREFKIVGWHDDRVLLDDDPRFNYEAQEEWDRFLQSDGDEGNPYLAVAKMHDGLVMMFTCNRPEGALFSLLLGPEDAA